MIVFGGVMASPVGTNAPPKYLTDGAAFTLGDAVDRSTTQQPIRAGGPASDTAAGMLLTRRCAVLLVCVGGALTLGVAALFATSVPSFCSRAQ